MKKILPDSLEANFADLILHIGCIKFGQTKLKSGTMSPIYCDLRLLRSCPDANMVAVKLFEKLTKEMKFDLIADIPMAITPTVAVLSHVTGIPMITPRPPKDHGTGASVEGIYRSNQIVAVFDDLITAATSKLEAIGALESKELKVEDVIVLLDRCQGGKQELEARGYKLHAALELPALLDYYLSIGGIDQARYDEVMVYLEASKPA